MYKRSRKKDEAPSLAHTTLTKTEAAFVGENKALDSSGGTVEAM